MHKFVDQDIAEPEDGYEKIDPKLVSRIIEEDGCNFLIEHEQPESKEDVQRRIDEEKEDEEMF